MRLTKTSALVAAMAVCSLCLAQHEGHQTTGGVQTIGQKVSQESFDSTVAAWMEKPREVARKMVSKYGLPDAITVDTMVWRKNGPWTMSILENVMIPHNFPYPHHDMLYQMIDHRVPESLFDDLARFDGSVIAERTRGTLGARCDYEEANFLAINLCHDIMTGKKSVGEAREFYAEAVSAWRGNTTSSEQSRYMSGFTFDLMDSRQGDPDAQWDGTYTEETEYLAQQENDFKYDENETETSYDKRSSKFVARMTGLPGRPDWKMRLGRDKWNLSTDW